MTQIIIPNTIAEATQVLGGIDRLLTAKGWERAAIVYAFTLPDPGAKRAQTSVEKSTEVQESISAFARRRITGLTTRDTIIAYRTIWAEHGTTPLMPGDRVDLPTTKFPETGTRGTDGYNSPEGARRTVEKIARDHPDAIVDVVTEDPEVRGVVTRGLSRNRSERQERSRTTSTTDPVVRQIDARHVALDLADACMKFATTTTDLLLMAGDLPEVEVRWLTEAVDKARSAVDAVARYIETGRSDMDEGLTRLLEGEAS